MTMTRTTIISEIVELVKTADSIVRKCNGKDGDDDAEDGEDITEGIQQQVTT